VNALHSLMLADGENFVQTPVYHVFDMYRPHMGAQAVRAEFAAPSISYDRSGKSASLWGLRGSASVSGKKLTLTVVNPHPSQAIETEIVARGASIAGGSGRVLTNSDIHAHNDFQNPETVKPKPTSVSPSLGKLVYSFAPASVTVLSLTLA
jgi:alpha-N-arabinofuranosidase